ncbi:hypothetical protein B0H66DRAFT_27325 [Apodospora peruviana]|uniref:Abscission/NoCut checkpoint regulator n=1 Tax=Apodospora peruviana TaxID=516989 RepID=A0AAE0IR42_9PEZI|nr:hypothetical protein B0H66DRAFT_27325 [Apodospora peruviana]
MASPRPSDDQSLLERLNALKPTSVTLDKSAITAPSISTEQDTAGPSAAPRREDALAERLRILRSQSDSGHGADKGALSSSQPQPPAATPAARSAQRQDKKQQAYQGPADGYPSITNAEQQLSDDDDAYLPFLQAGDDDQQALDDLLEGLGEFDLGGDEDFDTYPKFDPGGEAKKVSALLEQIHKTDPASASSVVSMEITQATTGKASDHVDDDESEGEQMTHEVERILSQARDQLAISEDRAADKETSDEPGGPPSSSGANSNADNKSKSITAPPTAGDDTGHDEGDAAPSFILPDVPSSPLSDDNDDQKSFDFANDISTRMASLKGIAVDAFGLPLAPTFQPQDRQPDSKRKSKKGAGYTDEDQKTWCIVCLDDATVRCVGCNDDVFCARCWRDMHIGPSAGYDERGHRWVKFHR